MHQQHVLAAPCRGKAGGGAGRCGRRKCGDGSGSGGAVLNSGKRLGFHKSVVPRRHISPGPRGSGLKAAPYACSEAAEASKALSLHPAKPSHPTPPSRASPPHLLLSAPRGAEGWLNPPPPHTHLRLKAVHPAQPGAEPYPIQAPRVGWLHALRGPGGVADSPAARWGKHRAPPRPGLDCLMRSQESPITSRARRVEPSRSRTQRGSRGPGRAKPRRDHEITTWPGCGCAPGRRGKLKACNLALRKIHSVQICALAKVFSVRSASPGAPGGWAT